MADSRSSPPIGLPSWAASGAGWLIAAFALLLVLWLDMRLQSGLTGLAQRLRPQQADSSGALGDISNQTSSPQNAVAEDPSAGLQIYNQQDPAPPVQAASPKADVSPTRRPSRARRSTPTTVPSAQPSSSDPPPQAAADKSLAGAPEKK